MFFSARSLCAPCVVHTPPPFLVGCKFLPLGLRVLDFFSSSLDLAIRVRSVLCVWKLSIMQRVVDSCENSIVVL